MPHLDDNAASELVSGTLTARELALAETHLAGCRECRALVAALAGDPSQDSDVATAPVDRISPSQAGSQPQLRQARVLAIGDRVGRYLVLSTLGTGGMGVVFAAYDPQLDRKIALKLLRAGGSSLNTQDARTRLKREAQAIAQLSHPNVVAAYDVGTLEDGDLYIAMEFVEGDTLTKWLKAYPRTWREIVDVFLQAARGLVAAHSVGLLHRDFKPDNVLVGGDGRVRVTDFGLARSLLAPDDGVRSTGEHSTLNVDLTATGTVLGTPRYMPPEQLRGPDIDARADQFSFCVALYEALYGIHPLKGNTSVSMLEANDAANPPPDGTKVPSTVAKAVMRGLERDRSKRFPTMAALIGELVPAPPKSHARTAVVVGTGVLLAGTAVAALIMGQRPGSRIAAKPNVGPLVEEMNTLEHDRRVLLAKLAVLEQRPTREELDVLKEQIVEKDKQIQDLVTQIVSERTATAAAKPPPLPPDQGQLVRAQIDDAQGPLEGCFQEWEARAQKFADMRVALVVEPSGAVTGDPVVTSGPDSVSLRLCVAAALQFVKYPSGPEQLEILVRVGWTAGVLNVSSRVTGHRELPSGKLDL